MRIALKLNRHRKASPEFANTPLRVAYPAVTTAGYATSPGALLMVNRVFLFTLGN